MSVGSFNLYPYKATYPVVGTGTKEIQNVTRAIYDGTTLTIWQEKRGDISIAYQADVTLWTKGQPGSLMYRWVDPETEMQGSLQKYTGCSCKYRNTVLSRTTEPSI